VCNSNPSTAQWRCSADDINTWHNSDVNINLIAFGSEAAYGIYFKFQPGYDTPSIMSVNIYPGQQTNRSVTYPVLTRYISATGHDYYDGKSPSSAWGTIDYAIHQVDANGAAILILRRVITPII